MHNFVGLLLNWAGFSSSLYFLELFKVGGFMPCLLKAHNEASNHVTDYTLPAQVSLSGNPSWDLLGGQP